MSASRNRNGLLKRMDRVDTRFNSEACSAAGMTLGRFGTPSRIGIFAGIVSGLLGASAGLADPVPRGSQASNLKVVGFSALGGHYGGFKLALNRADNGRWYLYEGHSFDQGWSILDVTQPEHPRYVKFVPFKGPKGWVTSQVTAHGHLLITAIDHSLARGEGPGAILWDISDPENPRELSRWTGGDGGTHRNSYPGGKYAYLSASDHGFKGRIIVILDVSDPAHPIEAGRWWQPGQKDGEPPPALPPSKFGPTVSFHGPVNVSPDGSIATTGFSPDIINLDISNPAEPKLIGKLTMVPPFPAVGAQSVHSVLPIWDRKLLFVNAEAMADNCQDPGLPFAGLVDNSDLSAPRLISVLPTPRPPPGAHYASFCEKGGRFGPHNTNQEIHNPAVAKPGNLLYVAWFNAGLRVFDISDAYAPTEVGWFLPPERPGLPLADSVHASPINWTEEVAVDTRGYLYVNDDKWGTWVLRYTGRKPGPTLPIRKADAAE